MGMKNKLGLMNAFMAMAMMGSNAYGLDNNTEPQKEETEEEKKLRLERKQKKAEIELNKANGLTEFFYGKNSVWALNQKTADKKAKKKGYL